MSTETGQAQRTVAEVETFGDDRLSPALLRLLHDRTQRGLHVTLLARNKKLPPGTQVQSRSLDEYVVELGTFLSPQQRGLLRGSTVHRYKGKQAEVVIIVDAIAGRYPLVHPNWFFSRVLGDTENRIEEDERRLLYVGLTRGRNETILLAEKSTPSAFVDTLSRGGVLPMAHVSSLPAPPSVAQGRQALIVHDGYALRTFLTSQGFVRARRERVWWLVGPPADVTRIAGDAVLRNSEYRVERGPAHELILEKRIAPSGHASGW